MEVTTSSAGGNGDGNPSHSSSQSSQSDTAGDEKLSELFQSRKLALEQAESVLDSVGGDPYLDGFNLLGVIANPRGTTASLMSTSFHGRYTPSAGTNDGTSAATTTGVSDVFTDAFNSLETTLTSVTGQMEVLNLMLEDWSRQILEDDTDAHAEGVPDAQLRELPQEMQNLNLQSLQNYLERCGAAAHTFQQILLTRKQEKQYLEDDLGKDFAGDTEDEASLSTLQDIPEIFFREEFDLTDPDTFRKLLIAADEDLATPEGSDESEYDNVPVSDLFPLLPPDSFGTALDRVELALLHQVRSKSSSFFAESLRFAKLQEWIESLLADIGNLQLSAHCIQEDLLDPMDAVPDADQQRMDLRRLSVVLDSIDEVLNNRDALSGIISDQDDLKAIEQINFSRRLLAGGLPSREDGDSQEVNNEVLSLARVTALKSVTEDLNQYEQLVVSNLSEELVEIFIGWNSNAVTSVYAMNGSGSNKSSQHLKDRALEIVDALQNCDDGLNKTITAYSNRLQDVIRMTVRTMVSEFASDGTSSSSGPANVSISAGATAMSFQSFLSCMDMLFEQLLTLLTSASDVSAFCIEKGIFNVGDSDENDVKAIETNGSHSGPGPAVAASPMGEVVAAASELASKSVSELLRLRKEAHSLISLDEMKLIWDSCQQFTLRIEGMSGHGSALRSTLMAQAKAFVERKHEGNMSALAAALDSEKWTQCEVSTERQEAITRLCTGRSVVTTPKKANAVASMSDTPTKNPEAEVEGKSYKVVWSCLSLVEMLTTNIAAATHFTSLTSGIVGKVAELLRLFNSRTTNLVLGAGAMNSNAKLKSINARHLSLVTHCVGFIISLLPHVRAALMAHMPKKQHTLLNDLDQIKKEYVEHNEKVLNKFVTILGGIVENNLSKTVAGTDFDERGIEPVSDPLTCCVFLEGVSTNTKRMHQVLSAFLSPDYLRDVFSRIFAYIDTKVPALLISASESDGQKFSFPSTDEGKKRLLLEVQTMIDTLNGLEGVLPWEFTAVKELGRQMEYHLDSAGDVELTSSDSPDQSTSEPLNVSNSPEKEASKVSTEITGDVSSVANTPEEETSEPLDVANGPDKEITELSSKMIEEPSSKANSPEAEASESVDVADDQEKGTPEIDPEITEEPSSKANTLEEETSEPLDKAKGPEKETTELFSEMIEESSSVVNAQEGETPESSNAVSEKVLPTGTA